MIDTDKALDVLNDGGVIVFPTETAYGLGADAHNKEALEKLYVLKGRERQPTHVLVSNLRMIKTFAKVSEREEKVIKNLMPGAVTLILELKSDAPKTIKSLSSDLGIGVRIPNNDVARELVTRLGCPLTAPSANPKGGVTPYSVEESKKQFDKKDLQPDYYLDVGEIPNIRPSTLVKITNDEIKILREGPFSYSQIEEVINK